MDNRAKCSHSFIQSACQSFTECSHALCFEDLNEQLSDMVRFKHQANHAVNSVSHSCVGQREQ